MATTQMQTSTDGENESQFNFDKWVNDNDLSVVRDLFLKHNMNTMDALKTTSGAFRSLMSDPELFVKAQQTQEIIPRIIDALNTNVESKIVHIFLSTEEEEAKIQLNKCSEDITLRLQKLNASNDQFAANIKTCESEIDAAFSKLQQEIEHKKQNIMNELKNIEKKKRSELDAKSQTLKDGQTKIENAIKSYNTLIHDANIDITERKNKIISITNDIKHSMQLQDASKAAESETNIYFRFNEDSISTFTSSLCYIYDDPVSIPIIDHVECKSIQSTEATIYFDASLSQQDQNKINSALFIKLECSNDDIEEKEKELMNSTFIALDQNKKKYQYKFINLKENKNYKMDINLYQSQNSNDDKKQIRKISIIHYKPISIQFTTLSSKQFVYSSDFDTNGIIYALGTNYGKTTWTNPVDQGLIEIKKSNSWEIGADRNVVERECKGKNDLVSKANNWISIDFKSKQRIKPTAYTLRHDEWGGYYLRNWNFEGSNDGNNWTVIRNHNNDASINAKRQSCTWTIENCNESYRMFRIYMTGVESSSNWFLMCYGFEIYGYLS